jgi:glycosyltransferase involved in cell wall biosynthesis
MLTGDLKRGALRSAEALVLPSHQENFGMAVAEAMAFAVPVLISRKVNIWREVDTAGAGLAEPDDLAGTVNLLERWIGLPEKEKEAMRANAYRCFKDHFEINRAADSLLSALRECGVCGINKENNPTFAK